MLETNNHTIPASPERPTSQDYEALRVLGLEHIQALSSKLWTDYNIHDAGITTLELLCYALTDLGYRTNFGFKDILTKAGQTGPQLSKSVFTAKEILTFNPITINDYRKLIIDRVPAVRNIWLNPIDTAYSPNIYVSKDHERLTLTKEIENPALKIGGLYEVKIELEDTESLDLKPADPTQTLNVCKQVWNTLQAHRNLCEDVHCVSLIEHEYVGICADIELADDADAEQVKKDIYAVVYAYVTPTLQFYSLEQLLDKGKSVEEIFQGSIAKNGFIDYDELEIFQKREKIYTSDLINLIMDIEGVKSVRKIHLSSYSFNKKENKLELLKDGEPYCLHLQDTNKAFRFRLDIVEGSTHRANKLNFYYGNLAIPVRIQANEVSYRELVQNREIIPNFENDLPQLSGKHRDIDRYYSIQNDFPQTYHLGKEGISDFATDTRKAQRLQFKAYLIFFEQLLADYLSQLNKVSDLLSWDNALDEQSYFYQALNEEEITAFNQIIENDNQNALFQGGAYKNDILKQGLSNNFNRRNRFLNHLLARFNDSFTEFSIAQFIKQSSDHTYTKPAILADKKAFLRTYPQLSGGRSKAFNYQEPLWNTNNLSGFEARVARKLGISNNITNNPDHVVVHSLIHPVFQFDAQGSPIFPADKNQWKFIDNRQDAFDEVFGFHIIEHHLLRPRTKDDTLLSICAEDGNFLEDCFCRDPYSFKVTAVMPGWLSVSMDMGFRKYVEKVMHEEAPAHIALKVCWISAKQMFEFEQKYYGFSQCLKAIATEPQTICYENWGGGNSYTESLNAFVGIINELKNIYPPSFLVECDDIELDENGDFVQHPIILNKTALKHGEKNSIWQKTSPPLALEPVHFLLETQKEGNLLLKYLKEGKEKTVAFNKNGSLQLAFKNTDVSDKRFIIIDDEIQLVGMVEGKQIKHRIQVDVSNIFGENPLPFWVDLAWKLGEKGEIVALGVRLTNIRVEYQIQFKITTVADASKNNQFFLATSDATGKYNLAVGDFLKRLIQKQHEHEELYFESQSNCGISIDGFMFNELPKNILEEIVRAMTLKRKKKRTVKPKTIIK